MDTKEFNSSNRVWNPESIMAQIELRRNDLQREANQLSAALDELRKVRSFNFGNTLQSRVDASFPPHAFNEDEKLAIVRRAVQNVRDNKQTGVATMRDKLYRILKKGRKRMSTNEVAELAIERGIYSRRDFAGEESFKASVFHHLSRLAQEGRAKRHRPEGGPRAGAFWQVQ